MYLISLYSQMTFNYPNSGILQTKMKVLSAIEIETVVCLKTRFV